MMMISFFSFFPRFSFARTHDLDLYSYTYTNYSVCFLLYT